MIKIAFSFSLLLLAALSVAQESLVPCDAMLESDSIDNIISARLIENLKLDRPPSQSGGWPVARSHRSARLGNRS